MATVLRLVTGHQERRLTVISTATAPRVSGMGGLDRLLRRGWLALTRVHDRARNAANRLPMEYWFWP